MFTRQAPNLNNSLMLGGVAPPQAFETTQLLGNCRQTLVHRGPIEIDYTSPLMRLITPEMAKLQFPNIRSQPPESKPKPKPKEEGPPEEPEDPLDGPQVPDKPTNPGDPGGGGGDPPSSSVYTEGQYIEVNEEERNIRLRANDGEGRRHCVFPSSFNVANAIHAVDYSVEPNSPGQDGIGQEFIKLSITDKARETVWKLEYALTQVTYLKDLRIDLENLKLYIDRETAWVFSPEPGLPIAFPLAQCQPPETPPTTPTT